MRFKKISPIRPSKKFQLAFDLDKNRYAQEHSGFFQQKFLPTIFCTERAIRSYCHQFTFLKIPSKFRAYEKAQNAFFRNVFTQNFPTTLPFFSHFLFRLLIFSTVLSKISSRRILHLQIPRPLQNGNFLTSMTHPTIPENSHEHLSVAALLSIGSDRRVCERSKAVQRGKHVVVGY